MSGDLMMGLGWMVGLAGAIGERVSLFDFTGIFKMDIREMGI
jgi:hypothetical protein